MKLLDDLLLNGTWELRDEILSYPLAEARRLSARDDGWIPSPVPGDVHQGLIAAGRIEEPLVRLNSFDCRWTEDRSWWFRKVFDAKPGWQDADVVELELNGLDSNAEIFVNGDHVGSHRNAFRPLIVDVKRYLQPGENVLLVRLTTGVDTVSLAELDAPDGIRAITEVDRGHSERGDERRPLVRKPQYSFGWDWSPRVATTAIGGDVRIRAMKEACIRQVDLSPVRQGDGVVVTATITVDRLHYYKTAEGTVTVALIDEQGRRYGAEWSGLLRSGYNYIELTIPITDLHLWWPNGLGDQHLYTIEARLSFGDEYVDWPPFRWGLRFVELDTRDTFAVIVNGKKLFGKGANWIPADAIYARVSDEQYDTLIREARDANFNMLRIWGGGWYEREAFYEACDRYGIMIWHDFMFACAPYPDHLDWFRVEVEREARFQTRRLRRHACMVLWCGNNENTWGFRVWWDEKTRAGAHLYNYILPDVVQRNCPEIPYWNSSPYGGDAPNSSEVGDRHHWRDCMMNPEMAKRIAPEEYDKCTSLFVSEFGYVGAPSKETVLAYMDGEPLDQPGEMWQAHTNTFEKDTVQAGIRKHYVDPEGLGIDDYLLYSGLCQGLMYAYALESMRYQPNCHGSLFWMYNDCWGEVGWTVIDYRLCRKPSYYFVRRAYAPVRLILRPDGEGVRAVVANGSSDSISLEVECGYVSLDGAFADLQRCIVETPPLERTEICVFPRGEHDPTRGLWIARVPEDAGLRSVDIAPAIFRAGDFRQLQTSDPALTLLVIASEEGSCTVRVGAQGYAHAVHFTLPAGALPSDNYFDLLPGKEREIEIRSNGPIDLGAIGIRCVNRRVPEGSR